MTLFYIPAFENGKIIAMLKLATNNSDDIRFYSCNFNDSLYFNETVNISLGSYELFENNGSIKSDINDIVIKKVNLAFKEWFDLDLSNEKISIDISILDKMTIQQWQRIFNI